VYETSPAQSDGRREAHSELGQGIYNKEEKIIPKLIKITLDI
jgi:hypothetical protein